MHVRPKGKIQQIFTVYGVIYVCVDTGGGTCLNVFGILTVLYLGLFFINPGSDVTSLHLETLIGH